jgi:hypothetical protein
VAYPLGLNRDQVEALRSLRSTPAFKHYTEALSRAYELEASSLFRALDHEKYLFQCGVCYAMEETASLIDSIDHAARMIDEHQSSARADHSQSDAASALFAGTAWWRYHQRGAGEHGPSERRTTR